jgi:hypothetical protein
VGIHDVDRLPRAGDTTQAGRRAGPNRSPIEVFRIGQRYAELCDRGVGSIVVPEQNPDLGLADAGRVRQHGLEDGLQLPGRARNDLQHVRGRGLLLQRLTEIVGALAQLGEQAGILDGDDGLLGKIAHQFDLLVGERTDFLAVDRNRSDELILLEHRHRNMRTRAGKPGRRGLNLFCCLVEGMDDLFRPDEAVEGLSGYRQIWAMLPEEIGQCRRRIQGRRGAQRAIVVAKQDAELGLADAGRVRQYRLEHRLQLAR